MLRGLILAFTGDQVASVPDEAAEEAVAQSSAGEARQALDQLGSASTLILFPVAAYQVIQGF